MITTLPLRRLALLLLCALIIFHQPLQAGNKYPLTEIKMLSTFLYAANGSMADGNRCVFAEQYSNDVDRYDAVKMTNPGENFGLLRQGYTLAVEARQPISIGDTLYYKMSNLAVQTYTVTIQVQYLAGTNAMAEFVDKFTNTRRLVSLSASTTFPVTVTTDPASKASDRFYLVFNDFDISGGPLPVKFISVDANQQTGKTVGIKWTTDEELNVDHYEVETSTDGRNFKTIGMVKASSDVLLRKEYSYEHKSLAAGDAFYRIRAVDLDGKNSFSKIVKTGSALLITSITAYPNPANTPQLSLRLTAAVAGDYKISIITTTGQMVYASSFSVRNLDHVQLVPVSQLINGHYIVKVTGTDSITMVQTIVIKK